MKANNTAATWAAVVIFVATLAALVALEMTGHDSTVVVTIAGPVVAALFITSHVQTLTDQQNKKLDSVERTTSVIQQQTNGVMDARIRDNVRAVLAEQPPQGTNGNGDPI